MTLTRLTFIRAALAASLLACLIVASPAAAQKEWVVHSFRYDQGINPFGSLVADGAGNLYGTTIAGGASDSGTVYEMVRPVPPKTGWTEKVLYSFTGGADGAYPEAGLVLDSVGNLYGTAEEGGLPCDFWPGCGVVFELSPPATAGSAWTESVLHTFSGVENGDGKLPERELIRDGAGNLYGTTTLGGSNQSCNCGAVFQLSPPVTPGGVWTDTILYSFVFGQGNTPPSGLVFDSQGNLYGTTNEGGEFSAGVVYRLLRPAAAGGTWTYKELHTFLTPVQGSSDGFWPAGALTLHGKRVIYGTTQAGGLYGFGTIFQLVPPTVPGDAWTENILYSIPAGSDAGRGPLGNLIFDSGGNIYGTTRSVYAGSIFELSPPPSDGPWTFTVLHRFTGNDGETPGGGLVRSKNGVLFGVTTDGGTRDRGVVYGLLP